MPLKTVHNGPVQQALDSLPAIAMTHLVHLWDGTEVLKLCLDDRCSQEELSGHQDAADKILEPVCGGNTVMWDRQGQKATLNPDLFKPAVDVVGIKGWAYWSALRTAKIRMLRVYNILSPGFLSRDLTEKIADA